MLLALTITASGMPPTIIRHKFAPSEPVADDDPLLRALLESSSLILRPAEKPVADAERGE